MMKKRILAIVLALAVVLCMSGLVYAANPGEQTIYLKGSGSSFKGDGWQNTFNAADDVGQYPQVWHLVYTGNEPGDVTGMQIKFTNGEVFKWTPDMGFSLNPGGNNPGWVIYAPYDWKIAYIDSGNNNISESYLNTKDSSNVNFNISGHNKGKPGDEDFYHTFSLKKTVDGIAFGDWIDDFAGDDFGKLADLLEGITFEVYRSTDPDDGGVIDYDELLGYSELGFNGEIAFKFEGKLAEGWYAVVEVFAPGSLAAEVFEADLVEYFYVTDSGAFQLTADFDYDGFYSIINGHGSGYVLGYPGLNNTGDIFYIGVKNTETGKEFASFCAHPGSETFAGQSGLGCSGYMVATNTDRPDNHADFLAAFNYIYDNFGGDLNAMRPVTQIVTWILLDGIQCPSAEFDAINWAAVEAGTGTVAGVSGAKVIVENVMANYKAYESEAGFVIDVVYLVCENPDHSFKTCQPQLVPIYGSFDNKTTTTELYGSATFTKMAREVNEDDRAAYYEDDDFMFDLFMFNEETELYDILINVEGPFLPGLFGYVSTEAPDPDDPDLKYDLEPGKYVFKERGIEGWEVFYGVNKDGLYFTIEEDGETTWDPDLNLPEDENPIVLNKQLPVSISISTQTGEYYSRTGSITGGYAEQGKVTRGFQVNNLDNAIAASQGVAPNNGNNGNGNGNNGNGNNGNNGNGNGNTSSENSGTNANGAGNGSNGNWFQFNYLDNIASDANKNYLGDNIWEFDLVQGDKLSLVGKYRISYDGDGVFTLSAWDSTGTYPLEFVGAKFSIGTEIKFAQNAKKADPDTIFTSSPGQQIFKNSGHKFSVKTGVTEFPAYIYIHLDGIKGWIGMGETEFTVTVTSPSLSAPMILDVALTPGNSYKWSKSLDNLKPGEYIVTVSNKAGDIVFGPVTKDLVGGAPTWKIQF